RHHGLIGKWECTNALKSVQNHNIPSWLFLGSIRIMTLQLDYSDIQQAAARIAPIVRRTTVLVSLKLNDLLNAQVWLKCEHLQHTNAFKYRGACNALLQLNEVELARGLVTVSSGNDGAALAAARQALNIPVRVLMAETASPLQRANMARYGAEPITVAPGTAARAAVIDDQKPSGRIVTPPH